MPETLVAIKKDSFLQIPNIQSQITQHTHPTFLMKSVGFFVPKLKGEILWSAFITKQENVVMTMDP
jgi:hypothetical protein